MADQENPDGREGEDMARNTSKGAEGEERPVREKLEHAAISSQRGSNSPEMSDSEMNRTVHHTSNESEDAIGKLGKKRSRGDLKETEHATGSLDAPPTPSSGSHQRKKTREEVDEEQDTNPESSEELDGPGPRSKAKDLQGHVSHEGTDDSQRAITPTVEPGKKSAAGNESPRKKRSAEEISEGVVHKPKIAATEEAQMARKSLDEIRPNIQSSSNGVSSSTQNFAFTEKKSLNGGGSDKLSTPSPFASLSSGSAGMKPSTFSGAGLSSGNTSSPFGAFGGGSAGAKSAFASPLAGSAATHSSTDTPKLSFANATSSFAAGSAFGGGWGSKLSSFASPRGDFTAASTGARMTSFASPDGGDLGKAQKARPFGAPADEESEKSESEDDEQDDDDRPSRADDTESREDDDTERNQASKLPSGEENEETVFNSRAKLYAFVDGAWKERGTGAFKLNIHRDSDLYPQQEDYDSLANSQGDEGAGKPKNSEIEEGEKDAEDKDGEKAKTQARFIMRATATHRIIINAPLFKEMLMGDPRDPNKPPLSKQAVFGVPEEGKMARYLLKIGREDELANLYQMVKVIQKKL